MLTLKREKNDFLSYYSEFEDYCMEEGASGRKNNICMFNTPKPSIEKKIGNISRFAQFLTLQTHKEQKMNFKRLSLG